MTKDDYLKGDDIQAQCSLAIRYLSKDNESLDLCSEKVQAFIDADEVKTEAYTTLKNQMKNYLYLIKYMKFANNIDIDDFNTLSSTVGNTFLIGSEILSNMENALEGKEEAQKKVDIYKELIQTTTEIVKIPYYEFQKLSAEFDVTFYQGLYDKWHEKEEKFDLINKMTSGLFVGTDSIRNAIERGVQSQRGMFVNGSFILASAGSWKAAIESAVMDCSNASYLGLNDGKYLTVTATDNDGNPTIEYGGNQGWFREDNYGDGSDFDKNIAKHGCGVIATVNFMYFMEGVDSVTREEYMQRVRDFVNTHPGVKNNLPHTGMDSAIFKDSIASVLDDYLKENKYADGIKWQVFSDVSEERIKNQLSRNIPVILQIGEGEKSNPKVQFYEKKSNGFEVSNETDDHYVTVTGIQTYHCMEQDPETKEDKEVKKTMLEISSWGQKYYIDLDEYKKFKDDSSGGIWDVYNNGYSNMSYVD